MNYVLEEAIKKIREDHPDMTRRQLKKIIDQISLAILSELSEYGIAKIPKIGTLRFVLAKPFAYKGLDGSSTTVDERFRVQFRKASRLKAAAKAYTQQHLGEEE